jgi:hypothetical protein
VACDQDGLAGAGVRVKNDLLDSDPDFRIVNVFLIEKIVWCAMMPSAAEEHRFFGRSKWAIAILFITSSHDGA